MQFPRSSPFRHSQAAEALASAGCAPGAEEVPDVDVGSLCRICVKGASENELSFLRSLFLQAQEVSPLGLRFEPVAASPELSPNQNLESTVLLVVARTALEAVEMGARPGVSWLAVLREENESTSSVRAVLSAGAGDCVRWDELSAPLLERALRFAWQHARVGAQQARLEQLNARLSGALENSSSGVMICDSLRNDCPILWVNSAMERLTGHAATEMIGRNPRFLGGRDTDTAAVEAIQEALQEEHPVEVTFLNSRRDGAPFWSELHLSPLRDGAGAVTLWIGSMTDVTQRVEAQRALQESRRDLEFAQRLTHLGSWWIALEEGAPLWHAPARWSDELFRLVGVEPGAIESTSLEWHTFVHPDDQARVRSFMEALEASPVSPEADTARLSSIEYRLRLHDGSEKWVVCNAQIERDAQGRKTRVVGTILDISERVRDAERLRESEHRMRAVVQNAPLLLWGLDAHGVFTSIQGRAMASIGITANDMVGQSVFEVMKDHELALELARRALSGEECEQAMWFGGRYLVIRYAPLSEGGALGVGVDMSETEGTRQAWVDSQRRFESIVSNVPGVVYRFFLSPDGKMGFEFVSPRAQKFWGGDFEWRGNELEQLKSRMPSEDHASLLSSIEKSARDLSPWSWRGRLFGNLEGVRWIHGISQPFRRDDGTIVWDGLLLDETDSTRARLELESSRAALEEAQSLAHVGSFNWNLQSGELAWSKTMFGIFGFEPNEVSPSRQMMRSHVHPDDLSILDQANHECIINLRPASYLIRIRRKNGEERFLQTNAHAERDEKGEPSHLLGSAQDVTEQILAQRALHESEERYALAARGANDGLWDWNLESDSIYLSARWRELVGCEPRDVHTAPEELISRVHPDDRAELEQNLKAHLSGESAHFQCEFRLRHENGDWVWMLSRGLAVRDEEGRATRIAGSQTDISARKRFEAQLSRSAFYDPLTGLPNRTLFHKNLERALSHAERDAEHSFVVLFLDLDRFKNINDSLGHVAGDQVLMEAGRRFESCLRPGDTVARLGGDEFAVLLDGVADASVIETIAGRMSAELEKPFPLDGRDVFITVSIGVAPFQGHDTRAVDLLRNADTAMYRAKGAGRARHALFDSTMHQTAVRLLELESDLWRALEREELRVFYQPIVALGSGRIHGFEALVRWQHPERGLVFPAEFIPLAEETGLIVPIDRWVLETACRQAVAWQQAGQERFDMAVNLSGKGFSQSDFVERVQGILENTGFDSNRLTLEITESILMQNTESASAMLRQLHALGITLAMDDFGTGYSSLSYLHRFSLDVLKIDRSFIAQLRPQDKNEQIISTILHLAKGLDMRAVAEGIESENQLRLLRDLDCDHAQGFYFSRPLPPEAIEELLATNPRW